MTQQATFDRVRYLFQTLPDICPTEGTAREFMDSIIQTAKDDPWFRVGQIVACYEDSEHGVFVAYGTITRMEWVEFYSMYKCEVETQGGPTIAIYSSHLRYVAPDEARMLFVRIEGGFPDLRPIQ